jgi:hypothetical protein
VSGDVSQKVSVICFCADYFWFGRAQSDKRKELAVPLCHQNEKNIENIVAK